MESSLKILNSRIILKVFIHENVNYPYFHKTKTWLFQEALASLL